MIIESLKLISSRFFFPLKSLIKNKNTAVRRSIIPTNLTFSSSVSKSPNFVAISPATPAGIVAIIIFKQYLKSKPTSLSFLLSLLKIKLKNYFIRLTISDQNIIRIAMNDAKFKNISKFKSLNIFVFNNDLNK